MRVRLVSVAEYDRHEDEVRFLAQVGDQKVSISIGSYALRLVSDALGQTYSGPLVAYAAGGRLLETVITGVVKRAGPIQATYLIADHDIFSATGTLAGMPHVPRPWVG